MKELYSCQNEEFLYLKEWLSYRLKETNSLKELSGIVFEPNIEYQLNNGQNFTLKHTYCIAFNKRTYKPEVYYIPSSIENDNKNKNLKSNISYHQSHYSLVNKIYTQNNDSYILKTFHSTSVNQFIEDELNILQYFGYLNDAFATKTPNFKNTNSKLCLILDFIPGDNLAQIQSQIDTSKLFESALSGLHTLHSLLCQIKTLHNMGFIHGDLRDENIIYNIKTKEIKLIDFGSCVPACTSKFRFDGNITKLSDTLAPEIHNAHKRRKAILAAYPMDIYSLGIIFKNNFFQLNTLPYFMKLTDRMLSNKPTKRPDLNEIIAWCNHSIEQELRSKIIL